MIPRLLEAPTGSFFLFGPRGTGKSTWLRARFPNALWIDLLEDDTCRALLARPERLRDLTRAAPKGKVIVIDEVQKVPALLHEVHALVEKDKERRFVLTGSSTRKLRRAGVDLLAGRLRLRSMHPFLAAELAGAFSLEKALESGLVPLVVDASDAADALKAYVALYLREEVQLEGLVRNLGAFSRFLEAATFSQSQLLNVSAVARDCQVERKVVEGYLAVVEDLLLAFRLSPFTRRAKRAAVAHAKWFFFDVGVFRVLRPKGPLDRPQEIDGAALEGLVAQHLRGWISYRGDREALYFWRTRSGAEVDFVVYGDSGLFAIEVKNARRVGPEDCRSLRSFQEDYPEASCLMLYRGSDRLRLGDVLCMPVEEFLSRLHPARGLPAE
jgi:predicted AAA+ superfamily ATPase